jgi:hypothetical protein
MDRHPREAGRFWTPRDQPTEFQRTRWHRGGCQGRPAGPEADPEQHCRQGPRREDGNRGSSLFPFQPQERVHQAEERGRVRRHSGQPLCARVQPRNHPREVLSGPPLQGQRPLDPRQQVSQQLYKTIRLFKQVPGNAGTVPVNRAAIYNDTVLRRLNTSVGGNTYLYNH